MKFILIQRAFLANRPAGDVFKHQVLFIHEPVAGGCAIEITQLLIDIALMSQHVSMKIACKTATVRHLDQKIMAGILIMQHLALVAGRQDIGIGRKAVFNPLFQCSFIKILHSASLVWLSCAYNLVISRYMKPIRYRTITGSPFLNKLCRNDHSLPVEPALLVNEGISA